jgi:hypothetical protein
MIPTQSASQLTVKLVLTNTKLITVALITGLTVAAVVLTIVSYLVFNGGVFQKEPEVRMMMIVLGVVLWAGLIPAGYLIPNLIFSATECQAISESEQTISLQPGSDVEALQQALDELDPDTRAKLLSSYLSRVIIRLAIFEAAGMINVVFLLLTGSVVNLALVILTLLLMVILFPSLARFRHWLECLPAA